ncbi:MAG TPA: hypothetical protein VKR53_13500 [Puia sp.]|nr:hypothetical protein [Puia sp.]
MKITTEHIRASFRVAKKVYESRGEYRKTDGKNELVDIHGMNEHSATNYIRIFDQMMKGKVFKKTMSVESFKYFLDHIFAAYGPTKLSLALSALQQHIVYLEEVQDTNLGFFIRLKMSWSKEFLMFRWCREEYEICKVICDVSEENEMPKSTSHANVTRSKGLMEENLFICNR